MPSSRPIITSTVWQLASQITMAALSVVTVKFVVIGLSKELAGAYNSAYGYLQVFGIVADFGLYAVSIRELSRAADKAKVLATFIVLRTAILLLSLGSALLIVWLLPQWQGTTLPMSVTIAAVVPLFTLLAGILRSVFQVTYRMHWVFVAEVSQRVLTVSAIGWLVLHGLRLTQDVHALYLFLMIGGIGAALLFAISLMMAARLIPLSLRTDWPSVRALLALSAPYGIAFLCVALYRQLDLTMIALLYRGNYEIQNAYYGFTRSITDMTYLIPTFLLNSTLPVLIQRHEQGEDTSGMLGKTLLTTLVIGSVSLLYCALWSRPLVALLTSAHYLSTPGHPATDTALRLLSVTTLLNGIVLFCFYSLLTKHEWRRLVTTMLLAVVLSISCNVWLIPSLGFVGAAYTQNIVNAFLVVALLPQTLRILPTRFPPTLLAQWLGFSALLGLGLWLSAPLLTSNLRIVIGLILSLVWMAACGWSMRLHRTLR